VSFHIKPLDHVQKEGQGYNEMVKHTENSLHLMG